MNTHNKIFLYSIPLQMVKASDHNPCQSASSFAQLFLSPKLRQIVETEQRVDKNLARTSRNGKSKVNDWLR